MDRKALLAGAGLGALLMFIADPDRGGRRRALVRDKAVRGVNGTRRAVYATAKDLANRTRGIVAVMERKLSRRQIDTIGQHRASAPA
jgi:hypothetical protein